MDLKEGKRSEREKKKKVGVDKEYNEREKLVDEAEATGLRMEEMICTRATVF